MKRALILFCVAASVLAHPPRVHATDYIFATFQCDPVSCVEEGPAEKSGIVTVDYYSTCTGGIVDRLDGYTLVQLANCRVPYIPQALVETSRTQYLDDCGDPYYVNYVTPIGEVFTVTGTIVFHIQQTKGCDGSFTNLITHGTKPC